MTSDSLGKECRVELWDKQLLSKEKWQITCIFGGESGKNSPVHTVSLWRYAGIAWFH